MTSNSVTFSPFQTAAYLSVIDFSCSEGAVFCRWQPAKMINDIRTERIKLNVLFNDFILTPFVV